MGAFLTVQYVKYLSTGNPVFTVVISKKTIQKSSARNTIKRIVYDSIRSHMNKFATLGKCAFIMYPQKNIQTATVLQIDTDIEQFLLTQK